MKNKYMIKNILLILLLLISNFGYSQRPNFDEVYNKIVQSKIKFPGLIMALAVAESGYNSYDEDSALIKANNLWLLPRTKNCNCTKDSTTRLAKYETIDISIADLNRKIGKLISGCRDEEQAVTILCWYYTEYVDVNMSPKNWIQRLQSIRGDTPYE